MGTRYIELDGARFEKFLSEKGFTRGTLVNEVIYTRPHDRCKYVFIRVCTSISINSLVGRECGADAIRVFAFFDNGERSWGIYKAPRVYRTGSQDGVETRTLERMREAYAHCNKWLKEHPQR